MANKLELDFCLARFIGFCLKFYVDWLTTPLNRWLFVTNGGRMARIILQMYEFQSVRRLNEDIARVIFSRPDPDRAQRDVFVFGGAVGTIGYKRKFYPGQHVATQQRSINRTYYWVLYRTVSFLCC